MKWRELATLKRMETKPRKLDVELQKLKAFKKSVATDEEIAERRRLLKEQAQKIECQRLNKPTTS